MISLPKFKELLGEEAKNLTDEDIERIRDAQYQFARLAFEKWAIKKGFIIDTTQESNYMV
ncbi:MAG: hypothetical protein WCT11_02830 [Candidatus Magasanikbacteria bacterium]